MADQRFAVILELEGGYSVHVPALPGCHSQGESKEEALANIKEAIELYLEYLKAQGQSLPEVETVEFGEL